MTKSIIAALQLGSDPRGTAATLKNILSYEEQIKESGCSLVVLPEALLGGYPKGTTFGARMGYRSEEGREEYLEYWEQAIETDGPEVEELCQLAQRCGTAMVVGVIEREGTTLYCTALYITEDGELADTHRKLMPTATERLVWGQGDGSTLPVVQTSAGKIGGAICWENYMTLLRTAMYAKGVEIWCAPTVDGREIWQTSMKHIAYEGRMFLVSANQYQGPPTELTRRDEAWPDDEPLMRGGSVIVSPMGEVLAGPLFNAEGLISAEIDLADIVRARYDMDPTGHYSRPDIFQLSVDEHIRPTITVYGSDFHDHDHDD